MSEHCGECMRCTVCGGSLFSAVGSTCVRACVCVRERERERGESVRVTIRETVKQVSLQQERCILPFPVADFDEVRYNFSTCEATGRSGPTLTQCSDYYSNLNSPITTKGKLFGFGSNAYEGAQGFKVPRSGLYNITVAGAAGGRGVCNFEYGRGLVVEFQANLSHKKELLILVGQKGLRPCDVNPDHELCQNSSMAFNESIECGDEWDRLLGRETLVHLLVGGGGGGGASMIWQKNLMTGEFSDDPLVIAGGGGGGSAILSYEAALSSYQTATTWFTPSCDASSSGSSSGQVNDSEVEFYQDFLNAKSNIYDECLYSIPGVRGISYRDRFSPFVGLVAGSGGGFISRLPLLLLDGGLLSESVAFAHGGLDCGPQLSDSLTGGNLPFDGVYGGFGGGGGGCGGGGGGGGYTGGAVIGLGEFVGGGGGLTPGGGGYSALNGEMDIPDFSLSDGDGYVEIVPADCGCVHECVIDGDQFECLCPNGTELAPDQGDCFYGTLIALTLYCVIILLSFQVLTLML